MPTPFEPPPRPSQHPRARFGLSKSRPRSRPLVCSAPPPSSAPPPEDVPALPADTTGRSPSGESANVGFVGAPRLGISFTCDLNGCGTRVSKMIRRSSYEKGTVLIMCPQCKVKHIISDNLGWYSDPAKELTNIEKIAESKGEKVVRVSSNVFDLEKLFNTQPTTGTKDLADDNFNKPKNIEEKDAQ